MATEKRLIDAAPIIDECREIVSIEWNKSVYVTWAEAEENFMERLLDAPALDAVEVVHGRWEKVQEWATKAKYRCSICGREIMSARVVNVEKYPYCHCGAKMDGDGNG